MEPILGRFVFSVVLVAGAAATVAAIVAGNRLRVRSSTGPDLTRARVAIVHPTLLYFWSRGCTQCRSQEIQIELAQTVLERRGRVLDVRKVDALAERKLAKTMRVMTVPTTVLLDAGGRVVAWNPGLVSAEKIEKEFDRIA